MDVTGVSPITEFDLCYILKGVTMKMIKKENLQYLQYLPMFFFLDVSVGKKMHTSLVAGELCMGAS